MNIQSLVSDLKIVLFVYDRKSRNPVLPLAFPRSLPLDRDPVVSLQHPLPPPHKKKGSLTCASADTSSVTTVIINRARDTCAMACKDDASISDIDLIRFVRT